MPTYYYIIFVCLDGLNSGVRYSRFHLPSIPKENALAGEITLTIVATIIKTESEKTTTLKLKIQFKRD